MADDHTHIKANDSGGVVEKQHIEQAREKTYLSEHTSPCRCGAANLLQSSGLHTGGF